MLRADVTGTDLILLQIALTTISGTVQDGTVPDGREDTDQLYRRYLGIVLDGLHASTCEPSELPVAALVTHEAHTLLQPRAHG
ncbi:MAG: hypothetical protein ACOC84_00295 [Actinomycetota bacterium]